MWTYKKGVRPKIPNIDANTEREGWKYQETLLVDHSGFGQEHERALTQQQFLNLVEENGEGYAYGCIDQGQFQVQVGIWKKKEDA